MRARSIPDGRLPSSSSRVTKRRPLHWPASSAWPAPLTVPPANRNAGGGRLRRWTEVSVDRRFERAVLAELALSERRGRRRDRSQRRPSACGRRLAPRPPRPARTSAASRVAVPSTFRPVAWLHHAREAHATSRALTAAGLTGEEVAAVDLLAHASHPIGPPVGLASRTRPFQRRVWPVIWPGSSRGRRSRTASTEHALRGDPGRASHPSRPAAGDMSVTELHPDARRSSRKPRNTADRTEKPRRQAPPGQRLLSPTEEIALARQIERGDPESQAGDDPEQPGVGARDRENVPRQRRSVRRPRPGGNDRFGSEPWRGSTTAAGSSSPHTRCGGSGARCSTRSRAPSHPNPRQGNQQRAAVRRAEAELERIGRRGASDDEIAARTELSETTVRSLRAAARSPLRYEPVAEDSTRLGDLIGDERAVDPPEEAIAHENRDEVRAMLRLLPSATER